MKSLVSVIAALAAGVVAAPALAQDEAASWDGFYAGGRLGYAFRPNHRNERILFDTNRDGTFGDTVNTSLGANAFSPGFCGGAAAGPNAATGCDRDRDGTDWAVHVGFDKQFGNIVVGVLGEYGRANVTDSVSAFSTTPASYTMTRRLRDNASVRLRAGYSFGGTLIYGTGGPAWGKIRHSFATTNATNSFTTNGNDKDWGYRYGGGIEQLIAPNFSIGLAYLYTRLKDKDARVAVGRGTALATNPFVLVNATGTDFKRSSSHLTMQSVTVTASYRF